MTNMNINRSDGPDHETVDEPQSTDATRRQFLRTATTAIATGALLGTSVDAVAADTDEILEVDLRDGVPPVTDAPQDEDEVIFDVHGYSGSSFSVSQARSLQRTLRQLDITETVTAVTWDDSGGAYSALRSARQQGDDFADWMEQYLAENPQTTVRILGHSMGGIVTFEFLNAAEGRFRIANADVIGSYERSSAPCEGSDFHTAIETVANFVGNYYSTNDSIARLGSGPAECRTGGSLPDTYADVDVSSSVRGHTSYKSSTGFGRVYISNFADGVDRADDEDDGADDGDDGTDGGDDGADDGDDGADDGDDGADDEDDGTDDGDDGADDGDDGADDGDDGADDGDDAPTVDSLDASERSSYFSSDIDAEWTLSDPNGDLATVELGLFSSTGRLLDSASNDIAGSNASGSNRLDPPFYRRASAVGLRVTDEAGNSTTALDRL